MIDLDQLLERSANTVPVGSPPLDLIERTAVRRRRLRQGGSVVGVLLVAIALVLPLSLARPRDDAPAPAATSHRAVGVPNVVGRPVAPGRAALERVGFTVRVAGVSAAASIPPGTVTAQSPAAGSVLARGSVVQLAVVGAEIQRPLKAVPVALDGSWRVVALTGDDGQSVLNTRNGPVTLRFDHGTLIGNNGCNKVDATYTRSGVAEGDLRFHGLFTTLVGCTLGESPLMERLGVVRHVTAGPEGEVRLHADNWMIVAQLERLDPRGSLTGREVVLARNAARVVSGRDHAVIDSASVRVRTSGVPVEDRGGTLCRSTRRFLEIRLVGDFHAVVAPFPGATDSAVRSLVALVDAATGTTCSVAASTRRLAPFPEPLAVN